MQSYASTVKQAQAQAQQAIDLYTKAQQATQQAQAQYQRQVDAYNAAAEQYDTAVRWGQNPGPQPTAPAAFSDPGAGDRARAQQLLDQARSDRDAAAEQAAQAIESATNLAPDKPSFWARLGDDLSDFGGGVGIGAEHLAGGVVKGVAGIADFARSLNPLDPYNITHPAEYVDGLSSTAAGLLHDVVHPVDAVKGMLGTGWGTDPAEALGNLIPNVALAAATDGAGTAADAGASLGERAALDAGENAGKDLAQDAGESAGRDTPTPRDQAGTPAENAHPPSKCTTGGDPVDVATGNVLINHVDLDLPASLPLLLERHYNSSYKLGGWFGPTWASTLDQRLIVDDQGVLFTAPDGVILFYPHPGINAPVLPEAGARWPLSRTADGGYMITDPATGHTRHFPRKIGGTWPIGALTDRNGNRLGFHYDRDAAPVEIHHAGGYRVRITTADHRVTALHLVGAADDGTDLEVRRYNYTDGHLTEVINSSGQPLRFTYDTAGRITAWTDRNNIQYRYTYGTGGRCVQADGPDGVLSARFDFDPDNRVSLVTNALGGVSRYEMDEHGHVIAATNPAGNITRWEYDPYGRLLTHIDPLGRATRYDYDHAGNLVGVTRPNGTRTLAEYTDLNQVSSTVGPDGAVWRYTYDEHGNRTSTTDPSGAVTRYTYNEHGHLVAITDPLDNVSQIQTDARGLPIAIADPTGAATRYRRDGLGRVIEEIDPSGGTTTMAWTVEGKLARRTSPDGATEQWAWDGEGNLIEHTDALGQTTRIAYTCFDKPLAASGPDGARVEYGYDAELRLVSVTNPQGLVWRYTYDPAGHLTSETDFNGRTLHYTYDPAGQLLQRVNGAGQVIGYRYDALGNVVEQHAGDETTTFAYDPAGRLIHAVSPGADLIMHRDSLGRVIAETLNGNTLTNTYDPAGRRTRRVTPTGTDSTWTYDQTGNPTALHVGGHRLSFTYDEVGREVERRLDTAFELAQTWTSTHRLATQTLIGGDLALAGRPERPLQILQRRAYTYRTDGNLTGIDDHLTGRRTLELDPTGRITAVRGPNWTEQYRYDPAGNQTHATWPVPAPAASDADLLGRREYSGLLLTRAGTVRYQRDPEGRVVLRQQKRLSTKDWVWRYTWDANDRLTGVITPDGTHWRYRYDPLGRRFAKQRLAPDAVTVADETLFTWDGDVMVEQTLDATHVTTWDYSPADPHRPVTQIERNLALGPGRPDQDWYDERFYAIITDLIGIPAELVDEHGTLAWHARTTIWGSSSTHLANRATTPLRFPGQYLDPETGLHYNYHRYYDPATARYTTADPLGLTPAPNPHSYVDNPTSKIDPLGLEGCGPGEAGKTKEQPVGPYDSFEQARNKALDLLGKVDPATRQPIVGRLPAATSTYGQVVGFMSYVDGVYKEFRLDYDPAKGPHINVMVGKGASAQKWAVMWRGTEQSFGRILRGNT